MTYDDLSPREREVIDLIGLGYTIKSIAQRLVISKRTAYVHAFRIRRKIGTSDLRVWACKHKGGTVKELSAQEIIDQILEKVEDRESAWGRIVTNAVCGAMLAAYNNVQIAFDCADRESLITIDALIREIDRMIVRDQ